MADTAHQLRAREVASVAVGSRHYARCTRSLCRRGGAIMSELALDQSTIVEGAARLPLYQLNSYIAEHYLGGQGGIYSHHRQPSVPNRSGDNVEWLHGIDPYAIALPPVIEDGGHHPADH